MIDAKFMQTKLKTQVAHLHIHNYSLGTIKQHALMKQGASMAAVHNTKINTLNSFIH